MTTSGYIRNFQYGKSLLTWDPETGRIVGQFPATGPISRYQYWNITHINPESGWEATVQNIETGLFVRVEDGRLTCGNEPTTFYAIEKDGLIGFQVPNGPTWDLRDPIGGAEVVLVLNGGEFTNDQKWKLEQ